MKNTTPIVSFTFDDIPDSALTNGAHLLSAHGVKGTFYVAGGLCGAAFQNWNFISTESVSALLDDEHEVGCHTFSHPDVQTLGRHQVLRELAANRELLSKVDARIKLDNFAYPYGSVGIRQKLTVQEHFRSCRGVRHGINTGLIDLGNLRAVRLYDATLTDEGIESLLDEALKINGWLIFYTHDVQDSPSSQGCTPRLLEHAVKRAIAKGFDCLTVNKALDSVGERISAPRSRAISLHPA